MAKPKASMTGISISETDDGQNIGYTVIDSADYQRNTRGNYEYFGKAKVNYSNEQRRAGHNAGELGKAWKDTFK